MLGSAIPTDLTELERLLNLHSTDHTIKRRDWRLNLSFLAASRGKVNGPGMVLNSVRFAGYSPVSEQDGVGEALPRLCEGLRSSDDHTMRCRLPLNNNTSDSVG